MQYASGQDKEMEDGMYPFMLFADSVKDRTYCIAKSAAEQPEEALQSYGFYKGLVGKHYSPAYPHIADHREGLIFFDINGGVQYELGKK